MAQAPAMRRGDGETGPVFAPGTREWRDWHEFRKALFCPQNTEYAEVGKGSGERWGDGAVLRGGQAQGTNEHEASNTESVHRTVYAMAGYGITGNTGDQVRFGP